MATREADGTVYTHAGPEIGVASTKAFTSQLVALHLLALYLAQARGTLSETEIRRHIEELLQIPQTIEQAIKASAATEKVAERFYNRTDFLFLGRGINYPIALEGALKLKEISYLHAEGYPAGEMKHGPIALIEDGLPVVALVPQGPSHDKILSNVQEAKARGGRVLAIGAEEDEALRALLEAGRDFLLAVPPCPEAWSPFLTVIPLQLLAYHVALRAGRDVDQPRNLAKSVTVE
jgi:glucosamine--fructose-6-phosphate aminotransferase (isomerizing)